MSERGGGTALALALHGVSLGYRRRAVLAGLDLELSRGDAVGVVGPNGSGKSTLLRGLLGLLAPLEGSIERRVSRLGYVPQRGVLDPAYPLSVRDVVEMGAFGRLGRFGGLSRTDRVAAREALDEVGLADRSDDPFRSLSGGQGQRALVARALLERPELLVLDEPTSGADPGAEARMGELLRRLLERDDMAVVIASHRLEWVAGCTRRAWVVREGRVDEVASQELLDPALGAGLFTSSERGHEPR